MLPSIYQTNIQFYTSDSTTLYKKIKPLQFWLGRENIQPFWSSIQCFCWFIMLVIHFMPYAPPYTFLCRGYYFYTMFEYSNWYIRLGRYNTLKISEANSTEYKNCSRGIKFFFFSSKTFIQ